MSGDNFKTLDLTQAQRDLPRLHQRVASGAGRVEITCDSSSAVCVMVSKAELESLERAIAILADSEAVREMTESLGQLAAAAGPVGNGTGSLA